MCPTSDDLTEAIRDKQRELAEAEAVVLRLRQALLEAQQAILSTDTPSPNVPSSMQPLNSTQMAFKVIAASDGPMHIYDVIAAIERTFYVQVRYATLVGNISRLVAKGKHFVRVGPNVFDLKQRHEEPPSADAVDPHAASTGKLSTRVKGI